MVSRTYLIDSPLANYSIILSPPLIGPLVTLVPQLSKLVFFSSPTFFGPPLMDVVGGDFKDRDSHHRHLVPGGVEVDHLDVVLGAAN